MWESLRRLARDLDGPQGEASGLFWFTHEHLYGEQPEQMLGPVWQKARNGTWRPLLGHRAPRNHGALKGTAYSWTSRDARYGVKSLHAGMPLPLAWEEFRMIACTPAGLSF